MENKTPGSTPEPKPNPVNKFVNWWPVAAFLLVQAVVGFIADTLGLSDSIRQSDISALLWGVVVLAFVAWVGSFLIVWKGRKKGRIVGYMDGKQALYDEAFRVPKPLFRMSKVVLWTLPLLVLGSLSAYKIWQQTAPSQTVVLVTRFVDPTGQDSNDFTNTLADGLRQLLRKHPDIVVKQLDQAIDDRDGGGSARALAAAQEPWHKAAVVFWGRYTLDPAPEIYFHVDFTRNRDSYLGAESEAAYGPADVQSSCTRTIEGQSTVQPCMFDFKADLGAHAAGIVAFAAALALFDSDKNLDAAPLFDTALSAIQSELGQDYAIDVAYFSGVNELILGYANRAVEKLEAVLNHYAGGTAMSGGLSLASLANLGIAYADLGQIDLAISHFEQVLAISREIGDRRGEGAWLGNLAIAHADFGQIDRAISYYEQALAISREIGDRRGEGNALGNMGGVYAALGQVERAISHTEQALAISREIGDPRSEGNALSNLGVAYAALGQIERAISYYEQALAISREIGDRRGEGDTLGNLGNAYAELGQIEQVLSHYEQALAISREIGDRGGEEAWLGNLGVTYAELGQVERAISHYEQALAISREIGDRRNEGVWLGNLGAAYDRLGQVDLAISHYEQALAIFSAIRSPDAAIVQRSLDELDRSSPASSHPAP